MKLNKNLVLVGMMGSGKSSIGKILAKKLEFEFIDTDSKIEEAEEKTISEIFKKNGEKYFRNIEEDISLKSLKLKNKVMKTTTILSFLVAIMLSSCTTVYYTQSYEDANYLSPNEFTEFDDYTVQNTELEQEDEIYSDTIEDGTIVNNYYEADDYYDFSYSARIRRFHRPVWSMGYYGGLYTDYYWYSYNPYHCGMSIYYGYNYYDPFYSPYYSFGYSPYYSYYNHHYYGNNHHYNYGYNHHNDVIYSYNNSYDNNSYTCYNHR